MGSGSEGKLGSSEWPSSGARSKEQGRPSEWPSSGARSKEEQSPEVWSMEALT